MAKATSSEKKGDSIPDVYCSPHKPSCKRNLFATPCSISEPKKAHSIESVRAKRRRYRQKKKDKMKEKEQWELRLEEGMRTRWRDRRINYENKKRWSLEKKDQAIRKLEEKRCRQEVQKEIERNCQKEIMDCQTQLYNHEASKTIDSTAALLLPTVRVPDNDHETSEEIKTQLPISDLSGIDSVCVVDYIQNVEAREAKALRLAKHYRDLAESIRSKSIKKQFAMEEKVELVRSFWRNEIKEGSSRAGLMVRRALQRRQHRNEDS